jgi:hypothetical protein
MKKFYFGLTDQEKEDYNNLVENIHNTIDIDKIKKLQTKLVILKEKGLLRQK